MNIYCCESGLWKHEQFDEEGQSEPGSSDSLANRTLECFLEGSLLLDKFDSMSRSLFLASVVAVLTILEAKSCSEASL